MRLGLRRRVDFQRRSLERCLGRAGSAGAGASGSDRACEGPLLPAALRWWHSQGRAPYGTLFPNNCREQLSVAYLRAVVTAARCTYNPPDVDYEGIDCTIRQQANHLLHGFRRN